MEKFDFWDFKLRLDDYFFEIVNFALRFIFFLKGINGRYSFMQKNIKLKNIYDHQRAFLVANGPSLKKQDLKLLKNEITFFVNRSFLHEDYAYIRPTYHIFVDPKLATGEWEITMLDEVLKKNPDVIFFLNYKWYFLDKFKPYIKNKNFNIYWVNSSLFTTPFHKNRKIDLTTITYGSAVTGVAFMASIYMGVNNFYFIGQDGNGLCYELTEGESHFYGTNPENHLKTPKHIVKDLYMMHLSLKNWGYFSDYCKKIGFNAFNCTEGGIFNMFERRKYEDIMNDK
ncbi:MAG: DUF115 domain-containing protein [Methyloprofundus sp.]|nr:DUF115 domain-containing protein [Methyloprofundus sp.]